MEIFLAYFQFMSNRYFHISLNVDEATQSGWFTCFCFRFEMSNARQSYLSLQRF